MADNIFPAVWQVLDGNGDPVAGAKAYFYDTGTTNARTVYSDSAGLTAHASPLVADGDGVFPEVFVTGGTAVKVVVKTSADVDVYTQDPVTRTSISSGASGISFTPTAEIAQTNVQDAIEQVQTNLDTGAFTNITASGNVTITGSLVFGGTTLTDTTGADTKLVSGTAGTSGNLVSWNGDGDAVDSTFAVVDEDDMTSDSALKVPTQQSVKAYVDTEIAGVSAGSWEFYDGVDGVLYDFSVDGAAASVETPTFDAGYDYMLVGIGLSAVNFSDDQIEFGVYRVTGAAYLTQSITLTGTISADTVAVQAVIEAPLVSSKLHRTSFIARETPATDGFTSLSGGTTHVYTSSAETFNKARIRFQGGADNNLDAGIITLYRRKSVQ